MGGEGRGGEGSEGHRAPPQPLLCLLPGKHTMHTRVPDVVGTLGQGAAQGHGNLDRWSCAGCKIGGRGEGSFVVPPHLIPHHNLVPERGDSDKEKKKKTTPDDLSSSLSGKPSLVTSRYSKTSQPENTWELPWLLHLPRLFAWLQGNPAGTPAQAWDPCRPLGISATRHLRAPQDAHGHWERNRGKDGARAVRAQADVLTASARAPQIPAPPAAPQKCHRARHPGGGSIPALPTCVS